MTVLRNKLQDGERVTITASGAVTKGDIVVEGSLICVAAADIADTEDGPAMVSGVFSMPKTTGEAWSVGDTLYWDASASKFAVEEGATLATGDISGAATAWKDAASGDATGEAKINTGAAKPTA